MPDPIDAATLESIAALAGLPLSADRRAALAPDFAALVAAANELSARIARDHRSVPPLLRFPGP
jgi:hypothetical protein